MATYLPNVTDVLPSPALYAPDFSFLDTMLRRRQGLYEQGFAQVNSQYNFVNRNVTNPYSAKVRDQFLSQAKNNLKNLAVMDLSQQQNVKAAKSVFDPFVKNELVLMDMAFTAHMDQQENIAESYRLKDGGKEFSEDNFNYLRQQRAAFANDNISSVGSYYANRRSYNPYYDYYKEIQEKMKDFRPSTYKVDRINGLYKITRDDKSWREAEVSEYLNGVLSDKAKQQMRIEAQVRLGNNPEALSGAYKQVAEQQREMNVYNMGLINKQLTLAKDPAVVNQLKIKKQQLEDSNREIDSNLQNIAKGDLSYIKNNSEGLASAIYFNGKLSGFVKSFAHDDITTSIDADQVGLSLMRENRADARQSRALAHAEKLKKWEVEGIPGNFQTREFAEGKDGKNLETSITALQQEVDGYEKTMIDVSLATKKHILNKIKERDPNSKLTINDITHDFIAGKLDPKTNKRTGGWLATGGPGGKPVSKADPYYKNDALLSHYTALQNTAKNKLAKIEEASMQGLKPEERKQVENINKKIDQIGTITLDDGTSLSARDLATGMKNGTVKVSNKTYGGQYGGPATHVTTFNINGRNVTSSYTVNDRNGLNPKNPKLLSAYNQIQEFQKNAGSSYDKFINNRQTFINNNFADLRMTTKVITFDAASPNAKQLEATASSLIPNADLNFQHAGLGVTASNQGNAYFYITPKSGSKKSSEDIVNELTAGGVKVKAIKTEKGPTIYEIQGLNNRVANQFRQYSPLEGAVINEMTSYTGVRDYASAPFTTPYGDTKFIIKKSGNLYYLHINGFGESFPDAFTTPIEAVSAARLLSADGGAGAKIFEREVSGSSSPTVDMSGMSYDYRYE